MTERLRNFFENDLENRLKAELMFGKRAVVAEATIADAFGDYLSKPGKVNSSDVLRIRVMNELIGLTSLDEPLEAWKTFQRARLEGHAPAGQDRYRSLLQSAINYYLSERGLAKVKIPAVKFSNERVRFLELEDRDRLIEAYPKQVRPIIKVLAYQGSRTQEALQLKWGIDGVDLKRQRIYIGRNKQGKPLTAPMHPVVFETLEAIWIERGKPHAGHVFFNRVGKPYTDTRDLPVQGGNPLKNSHKGALKRAGISDFTVHDWRHHWASHCVMAGIDFGVSSPVWGVGRSENGTAIRGGKCRAPQKFDPQTKMNHAAGGEPPAASRPSSPLKSVRCKPESGRSPEPFPPWSS